MDNKNEKTEEVIEIKEASVNEEANADNKTVIKNFFLIFIFLNLFCNILA